MNKKRIILIVILCIVILGVGGSIAIRKYEEEKQKQAQQSALGRVSTPEEFAKPAVFLLSPAASYLTGIMLTVDGGMYKGTL